MVLGTHTVRLKMAVLLLSVHSLPNQCVFHLYRTNMTDLPTYFPQTPLSLIKGVVRAVHLH